MAKKQTRRSISVRGDIYERVKKFCDARGISMSAFVEERILEYLDAGSTSKKKGKGTPRELQDEIGQHFTF